MEELNLDNILEIEEINTLFSDTNEEDISDDVNKDTKEENTKEKKETTEVVDESQLFSNTPESVGSGKEDSNREEDDLSDSDLKSSPKNFYSSIAKALKEENILPFINDDTFDKIESPEDLTNLIEEHIQSKLDEKQRRIEAALNADIEPSEIRKYENTIRFFEDITDEDITDESDKGETLRKQLIYQDFINRGYSKERAQREIQKSFNSGTDIEDAKEALSSNKEFFKKEYDNLIEEAKKEEEAFIKERNSQIESLKKSILEDKELLGDLQIDKSSRKKIFDNISKPIYKDPETGDQYTAIQKYEKENRIDFLKNIGIIFTLTDGFKNLDGLVKNKVRKEVKKEFKELEHTLNNTSRTSDGNLKYVSGVNSDPESFIGKEWDIDV